MQRAELTAANYPFLTGTLRGQLDVARRGITFPDAKDFVEQVQRETFNIPVISAYKFIETGLLSNQVAPIGKNGLRREGMIFSVTQPDGKSKLVKVFNNAGINRHIAEHLTGLVYRRMPEPRRIRLPLQGKNNPREKAYDNIVEAKGQNRAHYFATAEILVRLMAHLKLPHAMPMPTVLIMSEGAPVGFYLGHDQQIAKAEDVTREDTFFDMPSVFSSWPIREDLPPQVKEVIDVLKPANVLVYSEAPRDMEEQVLLDVNGQFVNFARFGYLLPQAGKRG